MQRLQEAILAIDYGLGVPHLRRLVKNLFGLGSLEHDDDFASVIEVRKGYPLHALGPAKSLRRVRLERGKARTGTPKLEARALTSSAML